MATEDWEDVGGDLAERDFYKKERAYNSKRTKRKSSNIKPKVKSNKGQPSAWTDSKTTTLTFKKGGE